MSSKVVTVDSLAGWDPVFSVNVPFDPSGQWIFCLGQEQAVARGGYCLDEPVPQRMVKFVAKHYTGHLTCLALARHLATLFIGTASGNILAFPARWESQPENNAELSLQNK